MKYLGWALLPIVKNWTKTQLLNITDQLNAGIRYFDFRIAPKTQSSDLYFVHGLYGLQIIEMVEEINKFLDINTQEVVFLDFQIFYNVNREQHQKLVEEMIKILGNKIIFYSDSIRLNDITLETLSKNGQQVFIFYRPEDVRKHFPKLWPSFMLPNPWANTMNSSILKKFLTFGLRERDENRFYVSQAILTPSYSFVILNFFSNLTKKMIIPCNFNISEWLDDQTNLNLNIVMVDYIDWNNYDLPNKVIRLNYRHLHSS